MPSCAGALTSQPTKVAAMTADREKTQPMTAAAATVVAVLLAATLMVPLSTFVRSQITEPTASSPPPPTVLTLVR